MKSKWTLFGSILAVLLLALAAGLTWAQGPEPPGEGVQPQGDVSIAAIVAHKISYQGVLKENGSPVTGNRNMTFRLYSDSNCTTQVGSDITVNNVPVTNGLFNVSFTPGAYFNGQALWLKVLVGGTDLGMCQEILPVPYALSLRPGAEISGDPVQPRVLYVRNTSTGYQEHGIYGQTDSTNQGAGVMGWASPTTGFNYGVQGRSASSSGTGVFGYATATTGSTRGVEGQTDSPSGTGVRGYASASAGTNYGVYGSSASPDGYGVYGYNSSGVAIKAAGTGIIQSTAATDWVVSPLKIVPGDDSGDDDLNIVHSTQFGWVALYTDGADDCTALLPVDVPALLFGTRVKFSSFHFCYSTPDTDLDDYIKQVNVEYVKTNGGTQSLCSFTTPISSTTWTCQACSATTPVGIYGPVFVRFKLHFTGDGFDNRIRLGNMYLHLTE